MRTERLLLLTAIWLTAGIVCGHQALAQYPDTFAFIEVPDPLSGINPTYPLIPRPMPAVGDSFWDNRFGTLQVRATAVNGIRGRHEYSRFDPFNSDQSMIILDPQESWNIYRTQSYPYNQPANLVRAVHLSEPRWDPTDPDLIWGVEDFSIKKVSVTTGQETVVKDFTADPVLGPIIAANPVYRITMKDEGESSRDKRYWAFMLQGDGSANYEPLYIFSYDRVLDTVLGVYALPAGQREIDWVGMSVLGTYVVILGYNSSGPIQGLAAADRSFSWIKTRRGSIGHADIGLDMWGREVVVGQNAGNDYIELVPLDTAAQIAPLVRLYYVSGPQGLQSGVHVSGNADSFALISTHIGPGDPEQNWLDRSIILVRLDPTHPRAFYLAKLYNTTQEYWEETHGTISNDGSKVVWADNWGQDVGQELMSITQLFMPANWHQLTGVEEGAGILTSNSAFLRASPNPASRGVAISFNLPAAGPIAVKLYNMEGRLIRRLHQGIAVKGENRCYWDGCDQQGKRTASGVYIISLEWGASCLSRRITLLR
jgi:hypothetical protein